MFICERLQKKEKELAFGGELWMFHEKGKKESLPYRFVGAFCDTSRQRLAGGVQYGVLGREWPTFSDATDHIAAKAYNMHEKIVLHGLDKRHNMDGLKVGIVCERELSPQERTEAFVSLGHVAEMASAYTGRTCLFGGDSKVSSKDLLIAWKETPDYIVGRPRENGGVGETGPVTATGVAQAIEIFNRVLWEQSLRPSIAISGLGGVGMALLREMRMRYWFTMIADTVLEQCLTAIKECGLSEKNIVSAGRIHTTSCAVFAPCALFPIIRSDTIHEFSSDDLRLIVSGQNDEIERSRADEFAQMLWARGIEFSPGPLNNSVGIQMLAAEDQLVGKTYKELLAEELGFHAAVVESVATQARDENRSVYSVVQERIRSAS